MKTRPASLNKRAMLFFVSAAAAAFQPCPAPPPPHPAIEIHPEFYLGWRQDKRPPEPAKLPWPLVITLDALDQAGNIAAGPMTLIAYNQMAGASFMERRQIPETAPAGSATAAAAGTNAPGRYFQPNPDASIQVRQMDFAAWIEPQGANSIRVKLFVKLYFRESADVEEYNMLSTVECRPGKNTLAAVFPKLSIRLRADWSKQSPYLSE